jgi:hypothetical protein
MNARPLLLAYQSVRFDSTPDTVENDRRILLAYAQRQGYALGVIYTELASTGELSAFDRLLEAVRRGGVAAVAVASEADLGQMPRIRDWIRARVQATGVPLLVVQSLRPPSAAISAGILPVASAVGSEDVAPAQPEPGL